MFVTGATGLLGGWLVKDLLAQGAEVVALVRDGVPRTMLHREELTKRITTVQGALGDLPLIRRTLNKYSVDTVFHLAAQSLVGAGNQDPLETLEANVRGTWNVLEACRTPSVKRIVTASSAKAYDPTGELPFRETQSLGGQYPYDVSKSCSDLICRMYAVTFGLPVAVARFASLFGGGDVNYCRLIPDLIRSTLQGRRFVIRSDGRFVRDFLYVRDAASACCRLAEHLDSHPGLAGEAFNFSLEIRMTVLEMVRKTLLMMGRPDLEPVIQNVANSEVREQYMVCDKARRLLGWSPVCDLEESLQETIQWYAAFEGSGSVLEPQALPQAAPSYPDSKSLTGTARTN